MEFEVVSTIRYVNLLGWRMGLSDSIWKVDIQVLQVESLISIMSFGT